jgi:hypothetical protein
MERLRRRLLVTEVKSEGGFFRKTLPSPAVTSAVSFYGGGAGRLAEAGFYRVGPAEKSYRTAEEWWLAGPGEAPAAIAPYLTARFGAADRTVIGSAPAALDGVGAVSLPAGTFVHVRAGPLQLQEGLTAVELDLHLEGISGRCPLTVRVQDPLNGRQELIAADVSLSGAGRARLVLDFPNQVLPEGAYLWLSLAARDAGRIVTGPRGSRLRLLALPWDSALPEALAYRKLLLKGYLHRGSTTRFGDTVPVAVTAGNGDPEDALRELLMTLAQCRWMSPADPELAEYERWLRLRRRDFYRQTGAGINAPLPFLPGRPRLPVQILKREQGDDRGEEGHGHRRHRRVHERDAPHHASRPEQRPRDDPQNGVGTFHCYFPTAVPAAVSN